MHVNNTLTALQFDPFFSHKSCATGLESNNNVAQSPVTKSGNFL